MPIQAPQWTEFLTCPICCQEFDGKQKGPISLGCGHTLCQTCLAELQTNLCPYDQTPMVLGIDKLPLNAALLALITDPKYESNEKFLSLKNGVVSSCDIEHYYNCIESIKEVALLLKPFAKSGSNSNLTAVLTRPMQRKIVTLINCQLVEVEGRSRALRAARSLGERSVTELILHHQNHYQLSANLWTAVRSRGCQFLGPAMQEEVLKLVLLALEDGSALSRKVLVMFVVQRLQPHFALASKTSIGHVVQLLYRASCFIVFKRDADSSLMQLKEEFRTYDSLRKEHDTQIVQIATEAGLRIAPDQWSSLLYGDNVHKSHMQSIMDKMQSPQSFGQSVQELVISLQRTGDPWHLSSLRAPLEVLSNIDSSPVSDSPSWQDLVSAVQAVNAVVYGLVKFIQNNAHKKVNENSFKTSLCRDWSTKKLCPRGNECSFAHSEEELEKFRVKGRRHIIRSSGNGLGTTETVPGNNSLQQIKISSVSSDLIHRKMRELSVHGGQLPQCAADAAVHVDRLNSKNISIRPTFSNNFRDSKKHFEHQNIRGKDVQIMDSQFVPSETNNRYKTNFVPGSGGSTIPIMPPCSPMCPPQTPIYAAPMQDFSFQTYQNNLIPQSPPHIFRSQNRTMMEMFPPQSPQTVVVNQGQMFNIVSPSQDYCNNHSITYTNLQSRFANLGECLNSNFELTSHRSTDFDNVNQDINQEVSEKNSNTNSSNTSIFASSLSELKERKEELLNKLEIVAGKEMKDEVESDMANGKEVEIGDDPSQFTSTYSIWTSGANLYESWTKGNVVNKDEELRPQYFNNNYKEQRVDDYNLGENLMGALSRNARQQPIQVSACNTTEPITTPIVYRPVPTISPMHQMIIQQPNGFAALVPYDPSTPTMHTQPMNYINTIGHGIIDPPHLHMACLEPSGIRPSDPISDCQSMGEEERQRQQLIAAKETGMEAQNLCQKVEEIRIKKELNEVMKGIVEKEQEKFE